MTLKSYTSHNLLNLANNVIFEQRNDYVNGIEETTNDITGKKKRAKRDLWSGKNSFECEVDGICKKLCKKQQTKRAKRKKEAFKWVPRQLVLKTICNIFGNRQLANFKENS